MKGFSLIEILIGMLITISLAATVLGVLHHFSRSALKQRKTLASERQLEVAWATLHHLVEGVEPAFWSAFPLKQDFWEPPDVQSGAIHFRQNCQHARATSCLTIWDVALRDRRVPIHEVIGGDLPLRLDLASTSSQGALARNLASAEPGDVVLVYGTSQRFAAIVQEVSGTLLYLSDEAKQPWSLPAELPLDEPLQATLIGPLTFTHLFLADRADQPQRRRIMYRKHYYSGYNWRSQRAKTTATQLVDLQMIPASHPNLTQIHIFAQPRYPQTLPNPITIANRTFEKEVYHAAYTF